MKIVRSGKRSLVALSLAALGLLGAPMGAQAQDDLPGGNERSTISNKVVRLDLESADLYSALKLLFSQIQADFTIPPELRGTLITVRLNQPFRIALETVLKASGLPITWKLENGVYSIIPIETPPDVTIDPGTGLDPEPPAERNIPIRLRVNNLSGIDIVAALGGRFIPWTGSASFMGFNPMGMMGGGMGMGMGGMGMGGMGMGGMGMGGMGMGGMGMGGMGMGGMGMGGMGMGGMGMGGMGMGMGGMGGGMFGGGRGN